jgi:hypothetical protein
VNIISIFNLRLSLTHRFIYPFVLLLVQEIAGGDRQDAKAQALHGGAHLCDVGPQSSESSSVTKKVEAETLRFPPTFLFDDLFDKRLFYRFFFWVDLISIALT